MRVFLDSSVVLAACGRPVGASRAIFDMARQNRWTLLTSRYVLTEVAKNLPKLRPQATTDWPALSTTLIVTRDVWTVDRPVVFQTS